VFHVTTWRTFSVPHGYRAKIHLCFSHCTDWAILALFCTETIVRRSSCNELARLKYGEVVVKFRKSFLEEQRSTATVLRMSDATTKTHTASQSFPCDPTCSFCIHLPLVSARYTTVCYRRSIREHTRIMIYKVVQTWPGLIVCKQVTVCPGHI
jgi:hypothetical protein